MQVCTVLTLQVSFPPRKLKLCGFMLHWAASTWWTDLWHYPDFSYCPRQKHLSFLFEPSLFWCSWTEFDCSEIRRSVWSHLSLSLSVCLSVCLCIHQLSRPPCLSQVLPIQMSQQDSPDNKNKLWAWSQFQWSLQGSVAPPHADLMFTVRSDSESVSVVTLQTFLINKSRGDSCAFEFSPHTFGDIG